MTALPPHTEDCEFCAMSVAIVAQNIAPAEKIIALAQLFDEHERAEAESRRGRSPDPPLPA